MRVLFDTNVLVDFLLDRAPHAKGASDLLSRADRGDIQGLACANSFTTIFYLARKAAGVEAARSYMADLLALLEVAPVTRTTLEDAGGSGVLDYEDAVVCAAASQANADCVVARNEKDFAKAPVPVYSPTSLLAALTFVDP
ncbi:MAG: PIN domain-containing protein [Gammaproteobacteria bacterium]|nr:PIN domain-containing protein [Gammaproteobacteria bacterium]